MVAYQKSASGAEFVVSVIHNNKPVREFNEGGQRVCRIPFNSEYKLRIKSKTWKKALVSVSIDGTDVLTGGKQLILAPYQSIELERFVDDLNSGKKFKFISVEQGARTGEVQDPTAYENGLIRVQIYPEVEWTLTTASTGGAVKIRGAGGCSSGGVLRGMSSTVANNVDYITGVPTSSFYCATNGSIAESNMTGCVMDFGMEPAACAAPLSDKGATAEGSHSSQQFHVEAANFTTETAPVTFDLWLKGVRSELSGNQCRDLVIHTNSMTVNFMGALHQINSYELIRGGGAIIKTVGGAEIKSPTYVLENN